MRYDSLLLSNVVCSDGSLSSDMAVGTSDMVVFVVVVVAVAVTAEEAAVRSPLDSCLLRSR
jgi:hypothetical protein